MINRKAACHSHVPCLAYQKKVAYVLFKTDVDVFQYAKGKVDRELHCLKAPLVVASSEIVFSAPLVNAPSVKTCPRSDRIAKALLA